MLHVHHWFVVDIDYTAFIKSDLHVVTYILMNESPTCSFQSGFERCLPWKPHMVCL